MNSTTPSGAAFRIWGVDNNVYGPVELPVLVNWVKEQRVTADTWIFGEHEKAWRKAAQWTELGMFFRARTGESCPPGAANVTPDTAMFARRPGLLRRVKLLADFSDEQLAQFVEFMHVQRVGPGTQVVQQGSEGNAMYLLLEGEARVRLLISGTETTLATLGPGEFFGEMSLFDSGPRSADVLANQESVLLRVSADAFEKLVKEAPQLAAPFLFAIGKSLAARIRADNKRYRDSIVFSRAAGR